MSQYPLFVYYCLDFINRKKYNIISYYKQILKQKIRNIIYIKDDLKNLIIIMQQKDNDNNYYLRMLLIYSLVFFYFLC